MDNLVGMYDEFLAYLESKRLYLEDPLNVSEEFNDRDPNDFTAVRAVVQSISGDRPGQPEAALIRGYRDNLAQTAEYAIRLMGRSDYYADALQEETDNIAKWNYNRQSNNLLQQAKEAGN